MSESSGSGDSVVEVLRKKRIKLWKPPYYGVKGADEALVRLAESTFRRGREDDLSELRKLRRHALDKLKDQGKLLEELSIKIIGAPLSQSSFVDREDDGNPVLGTWAERIEVNASTLTLRLVNPDLTASWFARQLGEALGASSVRLVLGGKTLRGEEGLCGQCLAATASMKKGKVKLLCLAQRDTGTPDGNETVGTQPQNNPEEKDNDEVLIDSIRRAAKQLQSGAVLDVTDAAGNLVSMSHEDRLAFLTALGLHALGRQMIMRQKEQRQHLLSSALSFLLEADREWNRLDETWKDRVDNYGLLQLDICWAYLKLESSEALPDAVRRLDRAELALKKQVHANFVTLALVQSEMGNPVPALSSIFVRLFLLQGVAHRLGTGNEEKSRERLDWAWTLAKSLRAVSPAESVARLREALGTTSFQATSALRRTEGNPDRAAELIADDDRQAREASEKRQKQRSLGPCANGTDYVDLQLLDQLQTVLGLQGGSDSRGGRAVGGSLLRLANNDLGGAIDLYQRHGRDPSAVLRLAANLDRDQGGDSSSRKRSRRDGDDDDSGIVVDAMALATLVSMGVNNDLAQRALKENNNEVDAAVRWATTVDQERTEDGTQNNDDNSNGDEGSTDATAAAARPLAVGAGRSPRETAEREAVRLLERVLGEVLQEQDTTGNGYLGNSLDEEWGYIEKYRGSNY